MYWLFSRYSRSSVQSCWARFEFEYPRITPDPDLLDAPESAALRFLHFLNLRLTTRGLGQLNQTGA
jgi:hypothetical protein